MIASSLSFKRFASARARTTPPTSGETTVRFGTTFCSLDILQNHRGRVDTLSTGTIEKTLNLIGVQIDRQTSG